MREGDTVKFYIQLIHAQIFFFSLSLYFLSVLAHSFNFFAFSVHELKSKQFTPKIYTVRYVSAICKHWNVNMIKKDIMPVGLDIFQSEYCASCCSVSFPLTRMEGNWYIFATLYKMEYSATVQNSATVTIPPTRSLHLKTVCLHSHSFSRSISLLVVCSNGTEEVKRGGTIP